MLLDSIFFMNPLVFQAYLKGLRDLRVMEALYHTRRNWFLSADQQLQDREDFPAMLGCDQTSEPALKVAHFMSLLKLNGQERVLEIGTGSGFQTAMTAYMAREVCTIEQHALLSLRARGVLDGLGFENIHFKIGDGTLGWSERGPYDRIIVSASVKKVPPALYAQLAEGGLMVIPVGNFDKQQITIVQKRKGKRLTRKGKACFFQALVGEMAWEYPPD